MVSGEGMKGALGSMGSFARNRPVAFVLTLAVAWSVLLVVLASLPPVVLTLHIARQDRQRQTAALRQRSQDIVRLSARKEDEMIAGTRQLLRAVAASSQVQLGRWDDCNKLLRTLFADYPRYASLGVIKTNGDVSASAPALTEPGKRFLKKLFKN